MHKFANRVRRRVVAVLAALTVAAAGLVAGAAIGPTEPAVAASVPYDPGYLISDGNFYNSVAMTQNEIQAFLVAQGSVLATYTSAVPSRAARPSADIPGHVYCNAFSGGDALSAAAIIYRAQAACGVSAKVLLVTLQKERGLIQKGPGEAVPNDFLVAMGYGCPDTAPCNELYYGFGNQVYLAALQFKFYQRPENGFNYQPGVRFIQYHPNGACGGSNVTIANWATAALYNYTPYQPTAASLAAWPGAASGSDSGCASYGNRNFVNFYTAWFGSPTGPQIPVGTFETLTSTAPNSATIAGWALDLDTQDSIRVHVYVDGVFQTSVLANRARSDIIKAYPSQTGDYGFSANLSVSSGQHSVCVYAIDNAGGTNRALGCRTVSVSSPPVVEPAATESGAVYRFWSDTYNGHFYTRSVAERNKLITQYPDAVWRYEGVSFGAFGAQVEGTVPVYRFWSATYNGHFYTTSAAERDKVIAQYPDSVWLYENVAFYVYPGTAVSPDLRSMHRFWSPTYLHHFYTADSAEAQKVLDNYPDNIWTYENVAFKVPAGAPAPAPLP